jgi:hypothetical protein
MIVSAFGKWIIGFELVAKYCRHSDTGIVSALDSNASSKVRLTVMKPLDAVKALYSFSKNRVFLTDPRPKSNIL